MYRYIHTYMYIFNLQRIQLTIGVLNVYYCYLFICTCLVFLILAILMQRHRNPASSLLNTSLYPLINQVGAWQCFRSHSHREIQQQQVCDHHKSAQSVRHLLLITVAESRNSVSDTNIFFDFYFYFFNTDFSLVGWLIYLIESLSVSPKMIQNHFVIYWLAIMLQCTLLPWYKSI